jgi:SagB-type dehydrogenase family enzyme
MLLGTGLVAPGGLAGGDMKSFELPKPKMEGDVSIERALQERRSKRKYAPDPVRLADASQLLWAAQGITDTREGLRTAPSAGALYPLELYLVAGNIENLADGVYRYIPRQHELTKTGDGDRRRALAKVAFDQSWIQEAAGLLVFSAVPDRITRKYGKRGMRYVYMEAGHAAQNVYLQAVSLGLATVVVGAFEDDNVKRVVGLEEDPLYLMPFGRPAD